MKKYLVLTLLLCLSGGTVSETSADDTPTSVKICTPEWEYYSQRDGKGLYHELWAEVFTKNNVKVDLSYAPYKRCDESLKKRGEYDVFPGDYEAGPKTLIPKYALGIDLLSVAYKKGTISEWTGQQQLAGKRVTWERGYGFDTTGVINVKVKLNEFNQLESAIKMIVSDRVDFLVDYDQALNEQIENLKVQDQIEVAANAIKGPKYYMTFTNTEKGRKLIEIWDREMQRLESSGKLHELYSKYEDTTY